MAKAGLELDASAQGRKQTPPNGGRRGQAGCQGGRFAIAARAHSALTKPMKAAGYGAGYEYDDSEEASFVQDYFPEKLGRRKFYNPLKRGFEREIWRRLECWAKLRRERS